MKTILISALALCLSLPAYADQCKATTKKGTQCKRQASTQNKSGLCWQHDPNYKPKPKTPPATTPAK